MRSILSVSMPPVIRVGVLLFLLGGVMFFIGCAMRAPKKSVVEKTKGSDAGGARDQMLHPSVDMSLRDALNAAARERRVLETLLGKGGGEGVVQHERAAAKTTLSCPQTCELSKAVCDSKGKLCSIAQRYPLESTLQHDCRWAGEECSDAQQRCGRCEMKP